MTLKELHKMTDEERKGLLESMGQEKLKKLAYYFMEFIEIMNKPETQARWGALKKALEIAKSDPALRDCNIDDDRFFELV